MHTATVDSCCCLMPDLLILQVEVLGNLHALDPADVAGLITSCVEGLLQGVGLLQVHHVQSVPSSPGQDV